MSINLISGIDPGVPNRVHRNEILGDILQPDSSLQNPIITDNFEKVYAINDQIPK